jgi:hypothetical protein
LAALTRRKPRARRLPTPGRPASSISTPAAPTDPSTPAAASSTTSAPPGRRVDLRRPLEPLLPGRRDRRPRVHRLDRTNVNDLKIAFGCAEPPSAYHQETRRRTWGHIYTKLGCPYQRPPNDLSERGVDCEEIDVATGDGLRAHRRHIVPVPTEHGDVRVGFGGG